MRDLVQKITGKTDHNFGEQVSGEKLPIDLYRFNTEEVLEGMNRVDRKRIVSICEKEVAEEWALKEGNYQYNKSVERNLGERLKETKARIRQIVSLLPAEIPSKKHIVSWFLVATLMVLGEIGLLNDTLSYNLNLEGLEAWLVSLAVMGAIFAVKIFIQRAFFDRSIYNARQPKLNALLMVLWGSIVIIAAVCMYGFIGWFRAEAMSWTVLSDGTLEGFDTMMLDKPWLGYGLIGSISVAMLLGVASIWADLGTKMKIRKLYTQFETLQRAENKLSDDMAGLQKTIQEQSELLQNKEVWWSGRLEELFLSKMSELGERINEDLNSKQQKNAEMERLEQERNKLEEKNDAKIHSEYHDQYKDFDLSQIMDQVMRNDLIDKTRPLLNGELIQK